MADITVRTIGYICPHCRQSVITDRSPFQLTASASCEILIGIKHAERRLDIVLII